MDKSNYMQEGDVEMSNYADEVDRHVAWVRLTNGATPQRSRTENGSAEVVFLANERMLTLLAGDDEGDDVRGTWFWGYYQGKDQFEFTIPYGDEPTPEQRSLVQDYIRAMGTDLPHRTQERGW